MIISLSSSKFCHRKPGYINNGLGRFCTLAVARAVLNYAFTYKENDFSDSSLEETKSVDL